MALGNAGARIAGGIQGATDANTNSLQQAQIAGTKHTLGLSPAAWASIFAGLAAGYILLMYFGHGGSRGSVL